MNLPADSFMRLTTVLGLLALGLCLIRLWLHPAEFLRGLLPASLFCINLPLGALALSMIHRLTGGAWGVRIRLLLRAAALTLPLNVLLFLILAAGVDQFYPWANGHSAFESTAGKAVYLNMNGFAIRELLVFLSWIGLAAALRGWLGGRFMHDAGSAFGLILYGVTITVFGIDWIMSLEPRWSSGNFGFLMMANPPVTVLSFAILAACATSESIDTQVLNDLGNLLLAGVLLWGYLEFQQYLTIWYENLPEKTIWYLQRNRNGWERIALVMGLCYSVLPFLSLLSGRIKRSRRAMAGVAALVLLGSLINAYWLTLPVHYEHPSDFHWADTMPFLLIGGIWLTAFLRLLERERRAEEAEP